MSRLLGFLFILSFALPSLAKRFDTSYLTIEIPDQWDCQKEESYWVCKDPRQPQAEILLFMFAKVAKAEDSVRGFWNQLSRSKTITSFNNLPIQSKYIIYKWLISAITSGPSSAWQQ
ncbi:MAG: hypothetical protein R2827_04750 [Bdellovibrionales bacterium]